MSQAPLPLLSLLLISLPSLGISFAWAIQIGLTSPFLLNLGINPKFLSYIWIAGPLSGSVTQPVIGILSDYIWVPVLKVRRQIYLWIGCALCFVSLLIFSWSDWIGYFLGDSWDPYAEDESDAPNKHQRGLIVAIVAFFVLDVAVNLVQGPLRVLLLDLAPPSQHTLGSSMFAFFNGIGNTLGFITGYFPFTKIPFLHLNNNIRPLYLIGAVVMVIAVALNGIFIREKREVPRFHKSDNEERTDEDLVRDDDAPHEALDDGSEDSERVHRIATVVQEPTGSITHSENSPMLKNQQGSTGGSTDKHMPTTTDATPHDDQLFQLTTSPESSSHPTSLLRKIFVQYPKDLFTALMRTPSCIVFAFLVQCCCYMAKFALYIYGSVWFGTQVFEGNCDANPGTEERIRCDDGVRLANFSLSIMAFLSVFLAPLMAWLSNYVSLKWIWLVGQCVEGVALCSCYFIHNQWLGMLAFSSMSITLTCMMSIPWSICSAAIREQQQKYPTAMHQEGLFIAIFNLSQCLPEFVVGLSSGALISLFDKKYAYGAQLAIFGCIGGFGGALLIFLIRLPESLKPKRRILRMFRRAAACADERE